MNQAPPLLIRNARVLTLAGTSSPRRGAAMNDLGVVARADVCVENGRVVSVVEAGRSGDGVKKVGDGPGETGDGLGETGDGLRETGDGLRETGDGLRETGDGLEARPTTRMGKMIDADGRVLMPAFVDAHTHACWAGERLDEWELKQKGASYLEILKAGGGIMSTVRDVRNASEDELVEKLIERLRWMLREGTTTAEAKSGYGLTTDDELKMLRAIRRADEKWNGNLSPTACIGHAIDPDQNDFIERTIAETLPAIHDEFPGIPVDAYIEDGAWTLEDTTRLFEKARDLGHPIRVHADQFNSMGMIPEAIRLGALSVDHLEASKPNELEMLAASDTFGVMLPCSGFHTDGRYADGRRFVDAGGKLVIATNVNPGSAPCSSMPMAIALAVRNLGITTAEAICACTTNAAALLGRGSDIGRIEPGMRADMVLLRVRDERELGHTFGGNPVDVVVCGGRAQAVG